MKTVNDRLRQVLVDYRHDRIKLGDAMRKVRSCMREWRQEGYDDGYRMGRYVKGDEVKFDKPNPRVITYKRREM